MDAISVFDLFKIGIGPSSSHTMGPWRAAGMFLDRCREHGDFDRIVAVHVDLYGSLAKTGRGHGTDLAVLMGLSGLDPATCDPGAPHPLAATIRRERSIRLGGTRDIPFNPDEAVRFHRDMTLDFHPNGLRFVATRDDGTEVAETYFSVGGGFVVREGEPPAQREGFTVPMRFTTAAELARHCEDRGLSIADVVLANERSWRDDVETGAGLQAIWSTMREAIHRGCHTEGTLPGGLGVQRRAPRMNRDLLGGRDAGDTDGWIAAIRRSSRNFDEVLRWVSCFALAVNEENAAFGRVVTAPTNGAAGVIPAVLMYQICFCDPVEREVEQFLLTAAAIGGLFKHNATISAAQGGCQAEIGVSSAMVAAGLCAVRGGTAAQALMAAEIAMEHHLGLTCDPIGGLVQVPCIERNAMGAAKAISACHLALAGDPDAARVSLDAVIRTMWATARDMHVKYKETSEGGLAAEISVNVIEC